MGRVSKALNGVAGGFAAEVALAGAREGYMEWQNAHQSRDAAKERCKRSCDETVPMEDVSCALNGDVSDCVALAYPDRYEIQILQRTSQR